MRHNNSGRKLGRNTPHRTAMMRNMVTSLIEHERITTTDTRAKELRKLADRMITLGKRGDLHARRQVLSIIRDKKVVSKLFERIAPRFQERPGGYTRIVKLGSRLGDNAPMSIIELVEEGFSPKVRKKAKPAPAVSAPSPAAPPAAETVVSPVATEEVTSEASSESEQGSDESAASVEGQVAGEETLDK